MPILTICFGIIFGFFGVSMSVSHAKLLISTSHGLDLSKVRLFVDVPHEYHESFHERVQNHLTQAGLSEKFGTKHKQGEPVLRLTLKIKKLGEGCSEQFLYTKKMEIKESVVTIRTPKVRSWAVTWSLGTGSQELRNNRITVEEMEEDLDSLMKHFLLDYQYANQ